MDAKSARFPRQLDDNGFYHSVCMTCFLTIAISSSQTALTENEWLHMCDGGSQQILSELIRTGSRTESVPH